jgi:CRP-like cAMP-binding protein
VLFQRGDPAEAFFFVESGQVELSLDARTGESKTLEVIGPGRVFAEAVAFMGKVSYPVTAKLLADSTLYSIPIPEYVKLLQANPDACLRLLGDICTALHARVREIERLTIQNARSRLSSYLLEHVVEASEDTDKAMVRLELPRHVIASRLSIQPETLSRLLRGLADEGAITIEDRVIFVHNVERLRPYT